MKTMLILALLAACGHKDPSKPDAPDGVPHIPYGEASQRLLTMLDDGWVVSRNQDGTARDLGDSLIFTGIAMGAIDCASGSVPEAALVKMLQERNGGVYRHPSIPDDYSLDGLLGLWWGIAHRTARCPETKAIWASLLPAHAAAVDVEPFFGVVRAQVMANLGVGAAPTVGERGTLGSEVAGWAFTVVSQRAAAYRLHLGFLSLDVVDAPKGKDSFCALVPKAKIALLEHFCGRGGLAEWTAGFAYNRYVYAFQRGDWEGPDGAPETPAIDLLVALSVLYPSPAIPHI